MIEVGKENFKDLVKMVPKKMVKDVVFFVEGENLVIKGFSKTQYKQYYNLISPLAVPSESQPFAVLYSQLTEKFDRIKDDTILLDPGEKGLVITGKSSKSRSYRIPMLDIASCGSYPSEMEIEMEEGKYKSYNIDSDDEPLVMEYPIAITIPEAIKNEITSEIPDSECFVLIQFRPGESVMYVDDGSTFSTFRFEVDTVEYDLIVNFGFRYTSSLLKGDVTYRLMKNPKTFQACCGGNIFTVGCLDPSAEYVKEFLAKCE